jgi:hypothetical protein
MSLKKNRTRNSDSNSLKVESVLVCTGVYNPLNKKAREIVEKLDIEIVSRDLSGKKKLLETTMDDSELLKADTIVHDILDVANLIIKFKNLL